MEAVFALYISDKAGMTVLYQVNVKYTFFQRLVEKMRYIHRKVARIVHAIQAEILNAFKSLLLDVFVHLIIILMKKKCACRELCVFVSV